MTQIEVLKKIRKMRCTNISIKSYFISNIIVEKMVQHLQDVIISERLVRCFFFFQKF